MRTVTKKNNNKFYKQEKNKVANSKKIEADAKKIEA